MTVSPHQCRQQAWDVKQAQANVATRMRRACRGVKSAHDLELVHLWCTGHKREPGRISHALRALFFKGGSFLQCSEHQKQGSSISWPKLPGSTARHLVQVDIPVSRRGHTMRHDQSQATSEQPHGRGGHISLECFREGRSLKYEPCYHRTPHGSRGG